MSCISASVRSGVVCAFALATLGSASARAESRVPAGWFSIPFERLLPEGKTTGSSLQLQVECIPVAGTDVPTGSFPAGTKFSSGGAIVGQYSESGITFLSTLNLLPKSTTEAGAHGKLFVTLINDNSLPLFRIQQFELQVDGVFYSKSAMTFADLAVSSPADFTKVVMDFTPVGPKDPRPLSFIVGPADLVYAMDCGR